jgi:hypothetical protein
MPALPQSRPNHYYFDGWAAVRDQLREAGIGDEQIFLAQLCTASHPHILCSYRRDGSGAGRMAAVMARS